jgi:PleD family two-component response regulator
MAEKLRRAIGDTKIGEIEITASFGVGEFQTNDTPNSLLSRVDEKLYKAKNRGRTAWLGEA